jgi:hypothetical protein
MGSSYTSISPPCQHVTRLPLVEIRPTTCVHVHSDSLYIQPFNAVQPEPLKVFPNKDWATNQNLRCLRHNFTWNKQTSRAVKNFRSQTASPKSQPTSHYFPSTHARTHTHANNTKVDVALPEYSSVHMETNANKIAQHNNNIKIWPPPLNFEVKRWCYEKVLQMVNTNKRKIPADHFYRRCLTDSQWA